MVNFSKIKTRQWYLLGGILGLLLIGGMVFWGLSSASIPSKTKPTFKNSLVTGASRINPQEAWVYQFRNEAEISKKRLDALEGMLEKLLKINEASRTNLPQVTNSPSSLASTTPSTPDGLIENIRAELRSQAPLTSGMGNQEPGVGGTTNPVAMTLPQPPAPSPEGQTGDAMPINLSASAASPHSFRSKSVRKISLSLKNARSNTPLKTVDNMVPAGAFAKAILLGGVDASASIQASSDPRPALLRLMDAGTLPRKFHSDLKGCHVLAACYGDISSERVFMRLEKLTCTERKTGEILEMKVQGYVAGEDGRTGVRGSVVDRAGASMRNAMVGGFLGGVGEFLSQSRNAVTFSPTAGLAQANPLGMGDMLKHGAGKGVNSALDKYADFYIKRAEQVQPIIQVAAGRRVDIVFTEGVSMGDSLYRQTLGKTRDQERYGALRNQGPDEQPEIGG